MPGRYTLRGGAATALAGAIGFMASTAHAERTAASAGGDETTARASMTTASATMTEGTDAATSRSAQDNSIRPFQFHASDEPLADLKRRIKTTKWPSSELVADDKRIS